MPGAELADAHPDPQEAFLAMKPVYKQAAALDMTTMIRQSNVDLPIAVKELCAVDPGFPTVLLVNGLGHMPLL